MTSKIKMTLPLYYLFYVPIMGFHAAFYFDEPVKTIRFFLNYVMDDVIWRFNESWITVTQARKHVLQSRLLLEQVARASVASWIVLSTPFTHLHNGLFLCTGELNWIRRWKSVLISSIMRWSRLNKGIWRQTGVGFELSEALMCRSGAWLIHLHKKEVEDRFACNDPFLKLIK